MDFLTKHWAPFRRQFPALFVLMSSDYLPEERRTIQKGKKLSMRAHGE